MTTSCFRELIREKAPARRLVDLWYQIEALRSAFGPKTQPQPTLLLNGHTGVRESKAAIPAGDKKKVQDALNQIAELYNIWRAAEPT
jgi:hypothetical protein